MWTRIAAVAFKEFVQVVRDWRTLTVVLVLPVVMVMLYGYAINFDLEDVALGVQDRDMTAASRDLTGAFLRSGYFRVAAVPDDPGGIDSLLDRGEAKAVLVIPRGFEADLDAGRPVPVQFIVDGADSTSATTALGYAESITQSYSMGLTVEAVRRQGVGDVEGLVPVEGRLRFWYNPEQRSTTFIVPGLTAVILMMMSTLLTALTVVREKERGTMEQLMVSPLRGHEMMLGKLIPYVVISYLDLVLVLGAGRLLFGVAVKGSIPLLLGLSFLFLMAALGTGMLISTVASSQLTAMTLAMMVSQLPTVLLSGFVFPVSAMPLPLQWLTNVIPARHYLVIVRSVILKGTGVEFLWRPSAFLLVLGVSLLALCAGRFKKKL